MSGKRLGRAWRATRFGEPADVLMMGESRTPAPGPGELRVRVSANGLNFLDVSICRGEHPVRPTPPFVPGAELVGIVSKAGAGAGVAVGERIVAVNPDAHGCFREEAIVPALASLPVPKDMPDEDAAAILVTYQTAFVSLCRRAALAEGEWVLVHAGAGALGSALIQVARARGANVVATAGSDAKLQACLDQGAIAAVNYREDDFRQTVLELTEGRGADVICDAVGGDVFVRSLDCIAFEGRLLPLGWASGRMPQLEAGALVGRNVSLIGVSWGSTYPQAARNVVESTHEELLRLYQSGAIKPFVSRIIPATDLPVALQDLADGASLGKLVMTWSPE